MDTNRTQGTLIIGDYEDNRDDFIAKSSLTGYTEYRKRYSDSPNPVKSRADIILTEIEKQLEVTESKYVSAMERLHYSRLLYDTAGSMSLGTNDYNRIDESPIKEKNSQSDISSSLHLVDDKNCENNLASGDTRYFEEANSTRQRPQDEIEPIEQSPVYTARSFKITSGSNIFHDVNDDNSNDWDSPNYLSGRVRGGGKNFSYEDSVEKSFPDNANQIREEHLMNEISPRKQHPYQLHLAEYSKGLQDELEEESRNVESPKIPNQEIYSSAIKSSRQQESSKKPVLHLNLSESMDSLPTTLKNKKSRTDKQRRVSSKIVSKSIDDTIGATLKRKRKKRGGVKTSNSRCTTATRETSISENKKDVRKRKQRGHSTIPALQSSQNRRRDIIATKKENNTSEVVEIYHNNAVKSGSISVTSSKHSKLMESRPRVFVNASKFDQPSRIKGSYRLVENNNPAKRICDDNERSGKQKNIAHQNKSTENCENYDDSYRRNLHESTDLRSGEPNRTNYGAECKTDESEDKIIEEYRNYNNNQRNNCQSPNNSSPFYDSLSTRNYELPTVASRMKQVHRSYFNRFNFRNIPFVVGTSVTPSYNLGLNIQEALSLMKTRQIMHSGISPLLISNVTKGFRPVTTLLGCIRDEDETLAEESSIPCVVNLHEIPNVYHGQTIDEKISRSVQIGPFPQKTPRNSCIHDTKKLQEAQQSCVNEKIETTSKKAKTRLICSSMKFNQQKNADLKPELTQSTLLRQRQEEINIGDSQSTKWQNVPQGTKGIREVLMNYSDQYEAMISKFEKLQDQAKKTSDKSLDKEIASLEKELNAKEEEIRAVSSLYQEVMILKQQMRMLHERNSLVCVATESPENPTYPRLSIRAKMANPIRMIDPYRRAGSWSNQGPPTSTRLAGLLRQIKTFQKRLQSNA